MHDAPVVDEPSIEEPASEEEKPKRRKSNGKPGPKVAKPKKKNGKPAKKGKGPKKQASYTPRGVSFKAHCKLAQDAHDHIMAMLKGLDGKAVAKKFGKSKSWYVYIRSGRTTPSLETLDALGKKLGYEVSLTIRKKGK